jgi:dolichol-phosphate mannosyltransferase
MASKEGDPMPLISIVSPVYRAEKIVPQLVSEIVTSVSQITENFEIVLVEDGSPDNSWQAIAEACYTESRIHALRLSRNFGQHTAITAGLAASRGTWIVVMDCDMQDRPSEIIRLYAKAMEGYETVLAQRTKRRDGRRKQISSKLFYALFSYLTETKQDASIANFGIYHRKVINSILRMNDNIRYFPAMVHWVGFHQGKIKVSHDNRLEGKSSYNFSRLLRLSINNIIAFSDKPLRLAVVCGFFITAFSLLIGLAVLAMFLAGMIEVAGYASLIISVWLTAGLQIFVLGFVGLYVGKSFEKVKQRPLYIIDTEINRNDSQT